ncbi:DUF882 domain-containing protein [bacterium]|nr:DUF882 domain-containing protein [bacterium]
MFLTKNFTLEEFTCKDGTPVPAELIDNVKELAENLQVLRDFLDQPVHILSGYRTEEHNKKVKGKNKSQHLLAKAADITTKTHSPRQLAAIIEHLIMAGKMEQGGLGVYKGFVHYDIRGVKSRW